MKRTKRCLAAACLAAAIGFGSVVPAIAGPENAVEENQQYTADVAEKTRDGQAPAETVPQDAAQAPVDAGQTGETLSGTDVQDAAPADAEAQTDAAPVQAVPVETKAETTNDLTRWSPVDQADTAKTVDLDLKEGLNKIELFFGPNTSGTPGLAFTSDKGRSYIAGTDSIDTDDFVFIKKQGKSLAPEYNMVGFITVYITKTEDENWKMTVTRREGTNFFIAIQSELPDNYKTIVTDYRTKPLKQILWMDKTDDAAYVKFIPRIIKRDTEIPSDQTPQGETPIVKNSNPFIIPAILILIIVAASSAVMKQKEKKEKAKKELSRQEAYIKKSNAKCKKQQKEENDNLTSYLKKYSREYEDTNVDMSLHEGEDDGRFDSDIETYTAPAPIKRTPAKPKTPVQAEPVRRTAPKPAPVQKPAAAPARRPMRGTRSLDDLPAWAK